MDRITAELLLGLKAPYGESDIAVAYKQAIRENHPDVLIAKGYSAHDANERAKQINIARDYLLGSYAEPGVESGPAETAPRSYDGNAGGAHGSGSASSGVNGEARYQHRSAWEGDASQKGAAWQDAREQPDAQHRARQPGGTATAGGRGPFAANGKRIDGSAPKPKPQRKIAFFAIASAIIGIAGLASTLLIFPPVGPPMDVAQDGGWAPVAMMAGPPAAAVCALVSRIRSVEGGRFRRTGLACAGLEYVYLAMWSWFLA